MTTYQIVDADHVFKFDPAKIACPICGAPIVGHFEAWEKTEDGNWQGAEHIKLDCTWEPDINSDEWEDWFESHWSTPYIDWLPLEIRLGEYINKKYRFKI